MLLRPLSQPRWTQAAALPVLLQRWHSKEKHTRNARISCWPANRFSGQKPASYGAMPLHHRPRCAADQTNAGQPAKAGNREETMHRFTFVAHGVALPENQSRA